MTGNRPSALGLGSEVDHDRAEQAWNRTERLAALLEPLGGHQVARLPGQAPADRVFLDRIEPAERMSPKWTSGPG